MCVLTPIGDPSLRIEWQHNDQPIPYSNRIQMTNDFGVISLLIKHLIAQDSGEYKFVLVYLFFTTNLYQCGNWDLATVFFYYNIPRKFVKTFKFKMLFFKSF